MVAALNAVSMAKTPKKLVTDIKSILESTTDEQMEERLHKLAVTYEALELAYGSSRYLKGMKLIAMNPQETRRSCRKSSTNNYHST